MKHLGTMDPTPDSGPWKVGDVARLTGMTVRALHHYDSLGLVSPSQRTGAGHRLYTVDDVATLYRVATLRRLGMPLPEVQAALDDGSALADAVRRHLADTRQRLATTASLLHRLSGLVQTLADRDQPSADDLFAILEDTMALDADVNATVSLLVYDDLAAAHDYLVRVFGLAAGPVHADPSGRVSLAVVVAGDHQIWLHPSAEDYVSPRAAGAITGMTVVNVTDVDAHHDRAVAAGADIVEAPVDQSYGAREYGARDLEGHLWFFHAPLG